MFSKRINIVVIGTTEFTLQCARAVLDSGAKLAGLVSMPADILPLNSADIKDFARKNSIPYFEFADLNAPEAIAAIRKFSPDYIFFSWSRMVEKDFLAIPTQAVIGSHPTDLPRNRGRHPLFWIIAQGISRTKLTFFRLDEEVDTGEVLWQVPINVGAKETIAELVAKVNAAAYEGVSVLIKKFIRKQDLHGRPQNHALANYWRKRTPHDVTVDFRLPAEDILRIVRSFSLPYPCANLIFERHLIKILRAKKVRGNFAGERLKAIEPGKILSVSTHRIEVKASDGIVELETLSRIPEQMRQAQYIHPPTKYFCEYPEVLMGQIKLAEKSCQGALGKKAKMMSPHKRVFDPERIRQLGFEYSNDVVKSLNKTGYMRNFICEVTRRFCLQEKTHRDVFLEVGCGLGAALQQQILCGSKNIVGVDSEPKHLASVKKLLAEALAKHPDVTCRLKCDSLPSLVSLKQNSFRSILCTQTLHYLRPKDFEHALKRFHQLLKKKGTLYMTVGSPYLDVYKGFANEYKKRLAAGERFPGYMKDVRQWHPKGATHNRGFFLFFDPIALKRVVSDFGFEVQETFTMESGGNERGQAGLIAVKQEKAFK